MAKTTFGKKLCEALGLDPSDIYSVNLHSEVGEADRLKIEQYADDDYYHKLGTIFKEYRLVKVGDEKVLTELTRALNYATDVCRSGALELKGYAPMS